MNNSHYEIPATGYSEISIIVREKVDKILQNSPAQLDILYVDENGVTVEISLGGKVSSFHLSHMTFTCNKERIDIDIYHLVSQSVVSLAMNGLTKL